MDSEIRSFLAEVDDRGGFSVIRERNDWVEYVRGIPGREKSRFLLAMSDDNKIWMMADFSSNAEKNLSFDMDNFACGMSMYQLTAQVSKYDIALLVLVLEHDLFMDVVSKNHGSIIGLSEDEAAYRAFVNEMVSPTSNGWAIVDAGERWQHYTYSESEREND